MMAITTSNSINVKAKPNFTVEPSSRRGDANERVGIAPIPYHNYAPGAKPEANNPIAKG
jgi:hypothetical protein